MRKHRIILSVLCAVLISQISVAQNIVWENPDFYNDINKNGLTVTRVEFYSDATIIDFTFNNMYPKIGWVNINPETRIKAHPSGRTYKLSSLSDIPYAPEKHYLSSAEETISFSCVFPAVPEGTTSLDWIGSGSWIINGIRSRSGSAVSRDTYDSLTSQSTSISSSLPTTASDTGNEQSGTTDSSSAPADDPLSQMLIDLTRSMTFNAFSTSFCYLSGNNEWSDFSEWTKCDFTIDYNAGKQQFVINTTNKQTYEITDISQTDPSVLEFTCTDTADNQQCQIQYVKLPENSGIQLYLTFENERICYAIKEDDNISGRTLPDIINNPSYSKPYTQKGLSLTKVVADGTQTVLHLEYIFPENETSSMWLSPGTCIKAYPSGNKYTIISAEGIPVSEKTAQRSHYKGEKMSIKAYFPAMPENTTHFDFFEEGKASDWVLCGISNNASHKRNFLMLNASDTQTHSFACNWYGGEKQFSVATTARSYEIIGVPIWCEILNQDAKSFTLKCKAFGDDDISDCVIVSANGYEVRINVSSRKHDEYTSPDASISDVKVAHMPQNSKIVITPEGVIRNMTGKSCYVVAYMIDQNGNVVNNIYYTAKKITPASASHTISSTSIVIDYSLLGISDPSRYKVEVGVIDADLHGRITLSENYPVIKKDRSRLSSSIINWGSCRLVAISQTNGDIAINGGNGYEADGVPPKMIKDIIEIRSKQRPIQDICITENGDYVIIYGDNGLKCSNDIPDAMFNSLIKMNDNCERITSAALNDNGEWIVISESHFETSNPELDDLINQGLAQHGALHSACLTNNSCIIVYENGYKTQGSFPETFTKALNSTNLNVYRIKIAGDSWFFADKEGRFQMSL